MSGVSGSLPAARPLSTVLGVAIVAITGMQLMSTLDGTIVIVALPRMQADLDLSDAGKSWVITAYVLTFGGLLLLGGRVGDAIGHKRAFISGVGVFTIASLACGLATDGSAADRRPRGAGHRRRRGRTDRAGADRHHLRRRACPQPGHGGVGGHAGRGLGAGPGARRCVDRRLLAAGIPDQPAHRHPHHRRSRSPARRRPTTSGSNSTSPARCWPPWPVPPAVLVFTQGPPRGWVDPWVIGAAVAAAVFFVVVSGRRTQRRPPAGAVLGVRQPQPGHDVRLTVPGRRGDADADGDDRPVRPGRAGLLARCGPGSASSRSRSPSDWATCGRTRGPAHRAALADHRRRPACVLARHAVRLDADRHDPVLSRPVRADRGGRLRESASSR